MDYLKSKTPPVREDRLGTGVAFGGTVQEVRHAQKEGCLNLASRSFSQTQGCQFTLSLAIINTMRNAVSIMHGPVGCGAISIGNVGQSQTFKRLRDPKAEGLFWLSTNLTESDVINGGEEKLREAIRYADKEFQPEMIIIAVSCVPALIGDDVDAVIQELQDEVAAKIVPVQCAGFKTKAMATAYDDVYHGILRQLISHPIRREDRQVVPDDLRDVQRRYRDTRTVNVLNVGTMSRADELELERLLTALELKVRYLPCFSDADDFRYVLESALNVSICGTHDDYFIKHLETLYNIPFIIDTMPVGRRNIARWLRKIAEHFDLQEQAERLIAAEDKALDEALEPLRAQFRGKTAFVGGGEVRVLTTAEVLQDLGFRILGLKVHHYDEFVEPIYESLDDVDDVVLAVSAQQPFEQINLVKRLQPDLYVGHVGGGNISAKQGLPLLPLFGPTFLYMGYGGVYEMARRIQRLMSNYQFNKKIAAHCPLPYRESWYAKDPFTYIKTELEVSTG
ncbi:MAG: nitrogenase [Peptococcaceae bacterium]|jgi:nitrogenase molybdenum-iron protein alpha chain|nr:nitrogenase [Peptococcaceae bacterium]